MEKLIKFLDHPVVHFIICAVLSVAIIYINIKNYFKK